MGRRDDRGGFPRGPDRDVPAGDRRVESQSRKVKGLNRSVRCTQGRGRTADGSLARCRAVPGRGNTRSGPLDAGWPAAMEHPTTRRRGDPPPPPSRRRRTHARSLQERACCILRLGLGGVPGEIRRAIGQRRRRVARTPAAAMAKGAAGAGMGVGGEMVSLNPLRCSERKRFSSGGSWPLISPSGYCVV